MDTNQIDTLRMQLKATYIKSTFSEHITFLKQQLIKGSGFNACQLHPYSNCDFPDKP